MLSDTSLYTDGNLVAYYKLENVNADIGGVNLTNNNTCTFVAAKFDNGVSGGTGNTNKSLSAANNLGIDGGAVSISLWIKCIDEIASGEWELFDLASVGTDVGYEVRYDYNAGTRRLNFQRYKQTGVVEGGNYNITLGTADFYHLVLTYDGANLNGYINNVLRVGPVAASGTGTGETSAIKLLCGQRGDGSTSANFASAIIDDFAVFSRELSVAEVSILYNSTPPSSGGNFLAFM